ncbi:MAG: tRNA lysidine(34) synthetase TilS [Flavobacteriales bacterium]|nr:tRNA lysidine(34) synthetase TilS [Flavobacteriales bacterium]
MPFDLTDCVGRFIRRERLLAPREPLFVAVSGGIDSMVLLHVLRKLGHACSVLHVNHGLRGAESDGDEDFVRAHCEQEGIAFRSARADVHALKAGEPVSTQMAARQLRYKWIDEIMGPCGAMRCAVGHHADDVVETLFINLLRGTGRGGWGAMGPRRGDYIRPLLLVHRADIEAYAREHGIQWREDSSNSSEPYQRNRIRHELLPLLESIRPGAQRTIARSTRLLRHLTQLGAEAIHRFHDQKPVTRDSVQRIPFSSLEADEHTWMYLYSTLRGLGFHPDLVDRVQDAIAERVTGATFESGEWQVLVDREVLIVKPLEPPHNSWVRIDLQAANGLANGFSWRVENGPPAEWPGTMRVAVLDADRLIDPVILRPWRPGDRIRPIGLGGSKLISDILIDAKVPMTEKDSTHVLVNGTGEIAWLVGHRIGEGHQATGQSTRVLRIALSAGA